MEKDFRASNKGITLIALVITITAYYDKTKKYSNINSFLFSKKFKYIGNFKIAHKSANFFM